jgi:hypothetical protein
MDHSNRARIKTGVLSCAAVLMVAAALATAACSKVERAPSPPRTVVVPSVIGAYVVDAKGILPLGGLVATAPPDGWLVVGQSPAAGSTVPNGSTVVLKTINWFHDRRGTHADEFRAIHGVWFLRYGFKPALDCVGQCHKMDAFCTRSGCHPRGAYEQLLGPNGDMQLPADDPVRKGARPTPEPPKVR